MFRTVMNFLLGLALCISLLADKTQAQSSERNSVVIHIRLSDNAFGAPGETFGLYALEDELEKAVENLGRLDGHEIGAGFFVIYVYGTSPEALIAKMATILSRNSIPTGSYVELHQGAPGVAVTRRDLPLAEIH